MTARSKRICSFCGRGEDECRLIITGLHGYICDECAKQAYEIVEETLGKTSPASSDKPFKPKKLPKPKEIKEFLDQYVIGQDDAKRYLAVSVYNHYKRLTQANSKEGVEIEKSNIIMVGSTGT